MKISKETIKILKNFSEINNGLRFLKGKYQTQIHPNKAILIEAHIKENIPRECYFYDLKQLLSSISKLRDPDLEFLEEKITVSSEDTTYHLSYCDASLVAARPDKELHFPDEYVTAKISSEDLKFFSDSYDIFQETEFRMWGDKSKIRIGIFNKSGLMLSEREISKTDKQFNVIWKSTNFKILLLKDYFLTVGVADNSGHSFTKFVSEDKSITYYIAIEPKSTFGE